MVFVIFVYKLSRQQRFAAVTHLQQICQAPSREQLSSPWVFCSPSLNCSMFHTVTKLAHSLPGWREREAELVSQKPVFFWKGLQRLAPMAIYSAQQSQFCMAGLTIQVMKGIDIVVVFCSGVGQVPGSQHHRVGEEITTDGLRRADGTKAGPLLVYRVFWSVATDDIIQIPGFHSVLVAALLITLLSAANQILISKKTKLAQELAYKVKPVFEPQSTKQLIWTCRFCPTECPVAYLIQSHLLFCIQSHLRVLW